MHLNSRSTLVGLLILMFSNYCYSQDSDPSHTFIVEAKNSARSNYDNLMEDQSAIFNGAEYVDYDVGINGNPFFLTDYYSSGTIEFDDMVYYNIPLIYEVVQNKVIIEYIDHVGYNKQLVLQNDKIKFFEYEGHHFVNINEANPVGSLKEGFYDLLLDDEISIYAKRKKEIFKSIKNGQMVRKFTLEDQYYIQLDSNTHKVSGKSSLLKLYGDRKNEMKQFIKVKNLDLKKNFEESLISVTREYIKVK